MTITHGQLLDRLTEWLAARAEQPWRDGWCEECGTMGAHRLDCLAVFFASYILQSRGWYHAPQEKV